MLAYAGLSPSLLAWNNGQKGNTTTTSKAECADVPYATHDWIADQAIEFLPDDEKEWLLPHRAVYLIGTEAPDHRLIPLSCGVPHRGDDGALHRGLLAVTVTTTGTKRITGTMRRGRRDSRGRWPRRPFRTTSTRIPSRGVLPYTATRRLSRAIFRGQGDILPAPKMDTLFSAKPEEFMDSVGESLNLGVQRASRTCSIRSF